MTDSTRQKWIDAGLEDSYQELLDRDGISKSEGWSLEQKEAIRKQMRTFIGDIVLELGSKGIHAKDVSKWIDYKTDMALAITKGEPQ